jgi:hypothetical protein
LEAYDRQVAPMDATEDPDDMQGLSQPQCRQVAVRELSGRGINPYHAAPTQVHVVVSPTFPASISA